MGHRILVAALLLLTVVSASDPELTTDFFVPEGVNASLLNGTYFTFLGFRNVTPTPGPFATRVSASLATGFHALQGLGISYTFVLFPPGTVNRPHTHPRGTELLYIIEGTLQVGFVDTGNKLYTQTLLKGDVFVFPKGLVHFNINFGSGTVTGLAAFSSSNAGTVSIPTTLFGSNPIIDSQFLATSFGVPVEAIEQLKQGQVEALEGRA